MAEQAIHQMIIERIPVRPVIAFAVAGALVLSACGGGENADPRGAERNPGVAEEETENCPTTWEMQEIDHGDNNRVLDEGIASVGEADTNDEAREAFQEWLDTIKQDNDMLAGNASAILRRGVSVEALTSEDGTCATDIADQLVAEVEAEVLSGEVTAMDPTQDMTNTGVNAENELVQSAQPGLSGDLDGISFTLRDGRDFGILRRCGNLVMLGDLGLPEGPTDNPDEPEYPATTTSTPSTIPPRVEVAPPASTPIPGEGVPDFDGPDEDNDPEDNTTTSTTRPPSTSTTINVVPTDPTNPPTTNTTVIAG